MYEGSLLKHIRTQVTRRRKPMGRDKCGRAGIPKGKRKAELQQKKLKRGTNNNRRQNQKKWSKGRGDEGSEVNRTKIQWI